MCGDNYDSNPKCTIEGKYDLDKVGSYKLVFKAEDSSGNKSEKNFTLNVNEPKKGGNSNTNKVTTDFSQIVKDYKNDDTQIGIDISKWQGDIDFSKLKAAGVEFVIIRVGSSNGINGENFVDSKFIQNIKNANAVGIPVGIYFYSYASTIDRAISDAKWIIEQIKDYKVDLPIAFDWENWGSFNKFDVSFFGLTNIAKGFMDTVKDAGYDAKIFALPFSDAPRVLEDVDVILLGPQVRFQKSAIEKLAAGRKKGPIPVEVIDMRDYGTMNGKAVFEMAKKLIGD